jgi:hypothetical protein
MAYVGAFIAAAVAVALWIMGAVVVNGLVLQVLWDWFVIPVFGLPALSLPATMGLSLLVNYLTQSAAQATEENTTRVYVMMFVKPVIGLVAGWIIHLFM